MGNVYSKTPLDLVEKAYEKLNGNYATTFTIWDWLFKTKINHDKE